MGDVGRHLAVSMRELDVSLESFSIGLCASFLLVCVGHAWPWHRQGEHGLYSIIDIVSVEVLELPMFISFVVALLQLRDAFSPQ